MRTDLLLDNVVVGTTLVLLAVLTFFLLKSRIYQLILHWHLLLLDLTSWVCYYTLNSGASSLHLA